MGFRPILFTCIAHLLYYRLCLLYKRHSCIFYYLRNTIQLFSISNNFKNYGWVWIELKLTFCVCVQFSGSCVLFTGSISTFSNKIFIKIGFNGTIHTFKNYFITIFLVFSNKRYPNEPYICFFNLSRVFCEIPTELISIVCFVCFLYAMICSVTQSLTHRTIHGSDLLFLRKESLIPPMQQSSLLLPALKKPANQRLTWVSRPLHVSNSVENLSFKCEVEAEAAAKKNIIGVYLATWWALQNMVALNLKQQLKDRKSVV